MQTIYLLYIIYKTRLHQSPYFISVLYLLQIIESFILYFSNTPHLKFYLK